MTSVQAAPLVLPLALAAGALIAAAVADLRSYQIPNCYAAAIALAFLVFAFSAGLHDALSGLAIGAITFALGAFLFAKNLVGGGDVKLLAAVALWVPLPLLAGFALVTSLAGAGLSLVLLTPLRRCLPAPPAALAHERALHQPVPFAVAVAAGGLFVLLNRGRHRHRGKELAASAARGT
jgi:prepilin peptidase CpaA